MKKLLYILLPILILALTACGGKKEDEPNIPTPEELTASIYDEFSSYLADDPSYEQFTEHIAEWAENKDIECSIDDNNIVVLSVPPVKGYAKEPSTVLECSLNDELTEEDFEKLAFLLYTSCFTEKHGRISAVITDTDSERVIPQEYLEAYNFINIDYGEDIEFVNSSPAWSSYRLTTDITRTDTEYNRAYEITVKGLGDSVISDITHEQINPIKQLSLLLANWKSSGYLYELSEFTGGEDVNRYPSEASVTVVISENDEDRFLSRIEKVQSKFDKQAEDDDPDYEFTVKRVALPEKVLSSDSTSDVISLLYTMNSGIYDVINDEDIVPSYTNLASIRLRSSRAVVKVRNFSMSDDIIEEMDDSVVSLSHISSFDSKKTAEMRSWYAAEEDGLLADLLAVTKKVKVSETQGLNICQIIKNKVPDIDCISLHINSNEWDKGIKMFTDYFTKEDA